VNGSISGALPWQRSAGFSSLSNTRSRLFHTNFNTRATWNRGCRVTDGRPLSEGIEQPVDRAAQLFVGSTEIFNFVD